MSHSRTATAPMAATASAVRHLALVGNPNCGKTALFNRLTGSRQKVANYTGVTVERKEGHFTGPSGQRYRVLDLPGTYSLSPKSPDEEVTRAVCLGELPGEPLPDVLIMVVSATNLRLHLRFALEVRALGRPMVLVINMMDEAARLGLHIDQAALARELGVPVVQAVAVQRDGARALIERLEQGVPQPPVAAPHTLEDLHAETSRLLNQTVRWGDTLNRRDERLDAVLLHPVMGPLILAAVLFLMFQAVFSWATLPMDGIKAAMAWLADTARTVLPDGPLRGLITDGVIAGAGSVLVFLPQILILFLFILALEESGYLPRAAFLLDKLMTGAGLSGRSFIPLLSSFACAVPGIMATRSIQHPRDRLVTILVAPLMTCSARLPVYALLIGAFVPARTVAGLFNLQGLVMFALYVAGIVSAVLVSMALKHFKVKAHSEEHPLLLELPAYRLPNPRDVALGLLERGRIFVRRVGTVIMALSVLLWGLASFPQAPENATRAAIEYSLAGMIGHMLEPVFAPIGFNWQICIALVPGMAAREVAVGALGTVYALSETGEALSDQLAGLIGAQWSLPTALAMLAWYVFAPQCISTLAVIRRETNSVRTMWLAAAYLTALAYGAALLTFHLARWMLG